MTQLSQVVVSGRPMPLGRSIGRGGEGEVFTLGSDSAYAVKIYNSAKRASRETKVMAMVQARLANKTKFVAYPIEVARYPDGKFAGFVMKLVDGYKPLFELYSPGARKTSFPKADFRFLVRTASNVARAVASVHQSGCVIGDINHSGILVSGKATVTLIDADSFQVISNQNQYLCRVGVPEYTPPELHGADLSKILRTPNHDAFGLAVVIFQLLFMGRHPFVGTVRTGEVPKIADAIKDFRFVYAENRNVGMDQPPGTLALSDWTKSVAQNFEQAFARESFARRPSALSWVQALEDLEGTLTRCGANNLHFYPSAASECPWCFMDQTLGMALFVPHFDEGTPDLVPVDRGDASFNLTAVWRQIEAVNATPVSALKPKLHEVDLKPSQKAVDAKRESSSHRFMGLLGTAGAAGVAFTVPEFWIIYVPLGWWGLSALFGDGNIRKHPFIQEFKDAELQWHKEYSDWQNRCGIQEFGALEEQLRAAKTKYERLPSEERSRIADYKKKRREVHLHRYLDSFQIHRAKIRGVGPAKEATLASYGIETAADIDRAKVLRVPGFGPKTTQPLLDWRQSKERRFVYDPKPNATDTQEIGQIRSDIANQKAQARKVLLSGPSQRRKLLRKINSTINIVDSRLNSVHRRRQQSKADLRYLGILEPQIPRQTTPSTIPFPTKGSSQPSRQNARTLSTSQTPTCPRCGSGMAIRLARRGRNAGNHFWGCSRFPSCRGTKSI